MGEPELNDLRTSSEFLVEIRRLSAKVEALRKALQGVASMSRCGQLDEFIGEPWLNAVFAALAVRPGECHHKWVNADNAHVEGADLCLNCGAIRGRSGGEG